VATRKTAIETEADSGNAAASSALRLERRRDARRKAILRAAGRELASSGYTSASLDKIADAVDISKAALYHYFPTKQALYLDWVDMVHQAAKGAVHSVLDTAGTPEQRLRLMIMNEVVLLATDFPDYARLFMRGMDWPDELAAVVHQHREEHEGVFRRVLQEGIETGDFNVPELTIARHCLQGCLAYIPEWYRVDGSISPEEVGSAIADMCMRMLRPAPGSDPSRSDETAPSRPAASRPS
jgi:AcrR family transcriptional regulator